MLGNKDDNSKLLFCDECQSPYTIPRTLKLERVFVLGKVDASFYSKFETINIDDEAIPLAKDEIKKTDDNPYWVVAKLVSSKSGKRLIVYAGDRNLKNKTQIFVEPDIRRVSFDHNDHHPNEVFVTFEGTFHDGTTSSGASGQA